MMMIAKSFYTKEPAPGTSTLLHGLLSVWGPVVATNGDESAFTINLQCEAHDVYRLLDDIEWAIDQVLETTGVELIPLCAPPTCRRLTSR